MSERYADFADAHAATMTKKRARELAAVLEQVRKRICQYGPDATRCDCKYVVGFLDRGARVGQGEHSGCPEVREAAYFLERWATNKLSRTRRDKEGGRATESEKGKRR